MTEEQKKPHRTSQAKPAAATAQQPDKFSEKKTKKQGSGATLVVEQIGSPIRRRSDQRETLTGLGLNKLHRRRELVDTPSVRGMISKVAHLVRIVESK